MSYHSLYPENKDSFYHPLRYFLFFRRSEHSQNHLIMNCEDRFTERCEKSLRTMLKMSGLGETLVFPKTLSGS
jgi:hypothetical protein